MPKIVNVVWLMGDSQVLMSLVDSPLKWVLNSNLPRDSEINRLVQSHRDLWVSPLNIWVWPILQKWTPTKILRVKTSWERKNAKIYEKTLNSMFIRNPLSFYSHISLFHSLTCRCECEKWFKVLSVFDSLWRREKRLELKETTLN